MEFKRWQMTEDSRRVTGRIRGEEATRMRVRGDIESESGGPPNLRGGRG